MYSNNCVYLRKPVWLELRAWLNFQLLYTQTVIMMMLLA